MNKAQRKRVLFCLQYHKDQIAEYEDAYKEAKRKGHTTEAAKLWAGRNYHQGAYNAIRYTLEILGHIINI